MELLAQIVRFVEEYQPPIVAAEFVDADGHCHTFVEKVAIFTPEWLRADSKYPHPGVIRCEVVGRERDGRNRELVRVTTDRPDSVESTEGQSEFVVLPNQLSAPSFG